MTTPAPRPPRRAPRRIAGLAAATLAAVAGLAAPPAPAGAVTASFTATGRISVTTSGDQVPQSVGSILATSADGRFVAFSSSASLVGDAPTGLSDVYLRDRLGGTTRRVSLTDADTRIGGVSRLCDLSRDGRFVAFTASGSGLPVPGTVQVYVRDRRAGTTTLASVSSAEAPSYVAAGSSGILIGAPCAVSDDGRYVAFPSEDGDLAPGTSGVGDVFRRDLQTGTTLLASVAMAGAPTGASTEVAMSGDGKVVAFTSEADNLVTGDTNGDSDVFVRAFASGTTHRMSLAPGGGQVEGDSHQPSLTGDGRRVAFTSAAATLVAGDGNGYPDVFVRDRQADTVVRASLGTFGELGTGGSAGDIGDDGRYVSFTHLVAAPVPGDANQAPDVLRRDLQAGTTTIVSLARGGGTGNGPSPYHAISGDGSVVAFSSAATDLVQADTNGTADAFVRDHAVATTPFGDVAGLVHQQYLDFVGRAPTASELETWVLRLEGGRIVPEQLVDELAHAPAWAGPRAPVIRLYWAFFLRVPDKAGLDYWIAEAAKGLSLPKMASKFAQSQEFRTQYGPLANGAFVTAIYQNVFDRAPDAAGLAYWKGRLDSGAKTRGDVMVGFAESAEGRLLLAPAVDSVLVWLGMLRTVPSAAWSIDGVAEGYGLGEPPEIVVRDVLALPAYAARVA